ncbi:MAG: sugar ABC transporter permease [Sphaerochaetaceae bacterium]
MKGKRIRKATPYLYLVPALLLAFLFCYRPFFLTILDSLYNVSLNGVRLKFVGLSNYRRLFASESFHDSWNNTLRFTAIFAPVNLVITFSLALLCNTNTKASRLSHTLIILPMAVAMSSAVLILKTIFDPNVGVLNVILNKDIQWFSTARDAMSMLVVVGLWLDIGFDFLLFSASLRNIPKDLEEEASLEGVTIWERLRYLEIPLSAPILVFVLSNNIKDAMLMVSPVMILTEGGPYRSTQTLVYQMYLEGFKGGNIALGSAIATIVFLATFLFLLILLAFQKRRVYFQ